MSENPELGIDPVSHTPKQKGPIGCFTVLAVLGIGAALVALVLPFVRSGAGEAARRTQCLNYLHHSCPQNHTTYLASVASNGCFRLTEPRLLSEITDGLSETLMVIEVPSEQSVPWMSPNDADELLVMSIGPESKLAHPGVMQAALCDGSVRVLQAAMPAVTRRALISIAEGDKVGDY